jgi:hypothetical protein
MSASAQPSASARSFAGLLADFASPEKKFPPARDFDGLAEDIAMLTYERALKTHARYRPFPDDAVSPETQPAFPGSLPLFETSATSADLVQEQPTHAPVPSADAALRKSASVTVRLTRAENEQLRQRAAEAGLTISAYLRSCAFEVETLRAQVKQTIAEMRHAAPAKALQRPAPRSPFSRLFTWRKRSA